ncbi:hypothetical protein CRG98_021269 [Punica granatum]|uniref:Uncharacterized protein n=1 Tax=Punica granatum TaxID=22663 RepID=A0A2I0JQ05_PUNGR|nr:hypothetical protein CRG98_021269 [Punica granatum]
MEVHVVRVYAASLALPERWGPSPETLTRDEVFDCVWSIGEVRPPGESSGRWRVWLKHRPLRWKIKKRHTTSSTATCAHWRVRAASALLAVPFLPLRLKYDFLFC